MTSRAHCVRCTHEVTVVRPWGGFIWLMRAWYAGMFVVLLLVPILLSEITVLLPLAMVFALACGPLRQLSTQPCTCQECGAEIDLRGAPSAS